MVLRDFKRGWALLLALMFTVTLAGPSYATQGNGSGGDGPIYGGQKVTLCHANNGNGWVENNVSVDSVVKTSGHDGHSRDIIPAFDYTVNGDSAHYAGKNLGVSGATTGQDIVDNGCQVPVKPADKVVPEFPTVVDECGTENDSYTLPSNTDSIRYTYSNGYAYAEITSTNTEWGDASGGWVAAKSGKMKFEIALSDEACQPEKPLDEVDMTTMLGEYQCDSLTVDVKTTTTTTPHKWSDRHQKWVLDTKNQQTTVTEETRALTDDEAAQCPPVEPEKVTEWVLWTLPQAGCTDASKLNMGFANADNSKGWGNCNTANKTFPQTHPKVMTAAALKDFVPACGTWYQADLYKGTQAAIDAVLEDGLLTYANGKVEDSKLVQKWFYLQGDDCTVTPVAPEVVDMCGANNDSYHLPTTEGISYEVESHDGHSFLVATMTADNTVWKLTEGWTKVGNTAELQLADFTNEPCVEVACWLMPNTSAPEGATVAAWFPQQRVDCDDPIPCGMWVQKDVYNTSTLKAREAYEQLGDTLEWVYRGDNDTVGHPEDSSIYMSHTFIYDRDCAAPELKGEVVAICSDGSPVLNYAIHLTDPDQQSTPDTTATIMMSDGDGNSWAVPVPFNPAGAAVFSATGSIPWPGSETGGWPGWEQDDAGIWHATDGNFAWTRDGAMAVMVNFNPDFQTELNYPDGEDPCGPPDVQICTSDWTMGTVSAAEFDEGGYTLYDEGTCVQTYEVCSSDDDGQTWTMATVTEDQLTENTRFWNSEADNGGCVEPAEPTLTGTVISPVCTGDVPWVDYSVVLVDPDGQSTNTDGKATITFHSPIAGIADEVRTVDIGEGRILWPGASIDADGMPTGWPGWAGNADDGWTSVGNDNFGWTRQDDGIAVTIGVNPSIEATLIYPPATPDCAAQPPTEITQVLGAPPLPEAPSAIAVVAEATFAG